MRTEAEGYFAIIPEFVLYADISDRAVRLYGVLRRNARSGSVSRKELAAAMRGCSVDSVDRALKELVSIQAVAVEHEVTGSGQVPNHYVLRNSSPNGRMAAVSPQPQDSGRVEHKPRRTAAATPSRRPAAPKERERKSKARGEKTLAADEPPRAVVRPRDPIFEGLADACGMNWHEVTTGERGKLNRAAAMLRGLRPPPVYDEIMWRGSDGNWASVMRDATKTPLGIANNWARLGQGASRGLGTGRAGAGMRRLALARQMGAGGETGGPSVGDGLPGSGLRAGDERRIRGGLRGFPAALGAGSGVAGGPGVRAAMPILPEHPGTG